MLGIGQGGSCTDGLLRERTVRRRSCVVHPHRWKRRLVLLVLLEALPNKSLQPARMWVATELCCHEGTIWRPTSSFNLMHSLFTRMKRLAPLGRGHVPCLSRHQAVAKRKWSGGGRHFIGLQNESICPRFGNHHLQPQELDLHCSIFAPIHRCGRPSRITICFYYSDIFNDHFYRNIGLGIGSRKSKKVSAESASF